MGNEQTKEEKNNGESPRRRFTLKNNRKSSKTPDSAKKNSTDAENHVVADTKTAESPQPAEKQKKKKNKTKTASGVSKEEAKKPVEEAKKPAEEVRKPVEEVKKPVEEDKDRSNTISDPVEDPNRAMLQTVPGLLEHPIEDPATINVYSRNYLEEKPSNWKNLATECYLKRFGEDDFKKYSVSQFPAQSSMNASLNNYVRLKHQMRLAGVKFAALAAKAKDRSTHRVGVGASGTVTIVKNPKLPDHEFFEPGRTFPVRLRHANLGADDDAAVDVRSAAIKFADKDVGGPFDMIMNTGETSVFWNLPSLEDRIAVALSADKEAGQREWLRLKPAAYWASVATLRRAPNSFADLRYYSHLVYKFSAKDGKKRYVRYRLRPYDDIPESGLLTLEEQMSIEKLGKRSDDDKRPQDYLRNEFLERVKKTTVKYAFQAQLHEWREGTDDHEIFNAGKVWDETTHPWQDVGIITLDIPLPPETTWKTSYNIKNQPSSLGLVKAHSPEDYNSIAYSRAKIYPISKWIRTRKPPTNDRPLKHPTEYLVAIKTGATKGAGTDAHIKFTLIGEKGRTEPFKPEGSFFVNEHERGSSEGYYILEEDVGDVVYIRIDIDKWGISPDWFVDYINVYDVSNEKAYHFPIYRWILSPGALVAEGTASLPQHSSELVKLHRKILTEDNRRALKWTDTVDLPNRAAIEKYALLPQNFKFSSEKMESLLDSKREMLKNMGLGEIKNLTLKFNEFNDFTKLFVVLPPPDLVKFWEKDVEFGYQVLNGPNPLWVRKCHEVPSKLAVTDDMVKNLISESTLDEACKKGRVYILDYEILEGIKLGQNRYLAYPICLLYVDNEKHLLPIVIQIHQKPGPENPVFTPNDSHYGWLYAKMWVKCADFQIHQLAVHLLRTHLAMEPVLVSAFRSLPEQHPVYKMLYPHFKNNIAINSYGRERLIGPGGIVDKFMSTGEGGHMELIIKAYSTWSFNRLNFIEDLKERGVYDPDELPGYYYRDDGLKIWAAVGNYVRNMINYFYKSDEEIPIDDEIQLFIKEMHDHGYREKYHGQHKFPEKVKTRDELIEVLQCMIYTMSAGHASANFGQFDFYGFIPNAPAAMYIPPPTHKEGIDLQLIIKAIPDKRTALKQMIFTYALSRYSDDEVFLGNFPESLFNDHAIASIQQKFKEELDVVATQIDQRNAKLLRPYPYMHPARIPNSIGV